ncbi:MAG TPA: hypothetical protein VF647_03995 [Longimicrobium sp.]|jgi:hypothetical protein
MANVPLTPAEIRSRLIALIEARRGSASRTVIGRLAREAGVQASTLARYFGLYPGKRQTERPHEATLRAVLLALGEDPSEFFRTTLTRQLEFWPAAVPTQTSALRDVTDFLSELALILRDLPAAARVRATRAATAAVLGSVAEAGVTVPNAGYELLRHLDALQREAPLKMIAS